MKLNDKLLRWIFAALIAISFAINYAGIFDKKMDMNGDNYYYFLLAQSLADGKGYVSEIGPEPVPHTHYPPGYPAFMSVFMHIFPGNIVAMKVLNGLLFLFSLLLLFQIIARTTGRHGIYIGLVACLLCTVHTDLLRWSTIIMSEMLYICISLLIVALFLQLDFEALARKRRGQILLVVLLCLLVFYTYFVRTMGISVILALMAALVIEAIRQKRWAPVIVCAAVALSLLAAHESWSIRNRRVSPNYHSDYLTTFQSREAGGKMSTVKDWTSRIGTNIEHFATCYIPRSIMHPVMDDPQNVDKPHFKEWLTGIVVIGLIIAGLAAMKGVGWLLVIYVFVTFGVLMLYPVHYGGTRYFIPVLPLMISGVISGVYFVLGLVFRLFKRRSASGWLQPALLGVLLVLLGRVYIQDQVINRRWASDDYLTYLPRLSMIDELVKASEFFKDAPQNVITCVIKPEIFYVHSGGHHAVALPRSGTPEEVIRYFIDNNVHFVIFDHLFNTANRIAVPAYLKYKGLFEIVLVYGDEQYGMTSIMRFNPRNLPL